MQTRLTFIGLWAYVDDNGVGRDVEKLIAAELYALEDDPVATLAHVVASLDELSRGSRITRYTVGGKPYLSITGWSEHQKIDRPNKPRYPQAGEADKPLTCDDAEPRDTLATPSRHPRDSPSTGAVEQGSSGTEDQVTHTSAPPPRPPAIDPLFEQFWQTYPRRVGKQDAKKAWSKAMAKGAAPLVIIEAASRHNDDPNRVDAFTKHPTSWLNAEAWHDEPLPARMPDRRTVGDGKIPWTEADYMKPGIFDSAARRAAANGGAA